MELEGEKTTHDFLSLCSKEPAPPKQGLFLKTHDFLQPLEAKKSKKASGEADVVDHSTGVEHVLPGGIGTYTISHVPMVKPEWPVDVAVTQGGHVSSHSSSYSRGGGFTLWEEPRPSIDRVLSGSAAQHWPSSSPYASRISNNSTSFGSLLSTRTRTQQDKGRSMDVTSRSGKGLTDDDEEDCGRQEGSSYKDLAVKVDAKRNCDQKPTTPRSKHSATEQRRRSKINDRFQILRDLIPHSDQKRDKASFLLEVIEYIQFLEEKSQKYESGYPGWSHDNTKLPSWKTNQMPTTAIDASHVVQSGPSPSDFVFSSNSAVPVAPAALANDHIMEYENVNSRLTSKVASSSAPLQLYGGNSGFAQPQMRLVADLENAASGSQAQQPRQPSGCGDMLKEQDLTIDDGTINISSAYSQGLLHILGETLQKSGMDLSQASISVQINLGKRAFSKLASSHKSFLQSLITFILCYQEMLLQDHDDPSSGNQGIAHSQMDSTAVESQQLNKRHKTR